MTEADQIIEKRNTFIKDYFLNIIPEEEKETREEVVNAIISYLNNNPRVNELIQDDEHFLMLCCKLFGIFQHHFEATHIPLSCFMHVLFTRMIQHMHFGKQITFDEIENALLLTGEGIRKQYAEDILYCERIAFERALNIPSSFGAKKSDGFWFYPTEEHGRSDEMWRTFFLARYIKHAIELNQQDDEYFRIAQWMHLNNKSSTVCQFVFELMLTNGTESDFESLKRFTRVCFPGEFVPSTQVDWVLGALDTLLTLNPSSESWTETDPLRLFLLSRNPDALKNYPRLEEWTHRVLPLNIDHESSPLPVSAITKMIDVIQNNYSNSTDRCRESPVMKTLRLSIAETKKSELNPASSICTIL